MQNKFNPQVPFEGSASQYSPNFKSVPDIAAKQEAEFNRFERSLQPYEQQMRANQDARIANARVDYEEDARFYKDAAQFSKTALDLWSGIEKQSRKDREDGETYDALFTRQDAPDTTATQQEDEAVDVGNAQAPIVSNLANAAEEEGGPEAAQVVRQQVGGLARGVMNERALLTQAQTNYPSWLASYLASDRKITVNGQQMLVREAARSLDPMVRQAALVEGRFAFIKEFGLSGATKRNMVRYLSNTVIQAEAAIGRSLAEGAIKADREQTIKFAEGLTYDAGQAASTTDLQNVYNEGSAQLFNQDTGLSRGEASDRAFNSLVEGLVEANNTDALEALRDVQRVPGQNGTEFGRTHGRQIDEAIRRAGERGRANRRNSVAGIEQRMYQQLDGAKTTAEREVIVRQAANDMRDAGAWKEADALLGNFEALNQPGGIEINDARTLEAVTNGEITTRAELDELKQSDQISAQGYTAAVEALNTLTDSKPSNDPMINRQVDSYGDSFDSDFLTAVGIKRDQNGNLTVEVLQNESPILTVGQAEIIREQARADMTRVANDVRRLNPDVGQAKQMELIHKALREWYQNNVMTAGGKYYVGDLKQLTSIPALDERRAQIQQAGRNRFRDLLASPGVMSQIRGVVEPFKPRPFEDQVSVGQPVPPSVREDYNPLRGDTVFSIDDTKKFGTTYDANGTFSPHLISVAQQLGRSPLALLNQQLRAHGLPTKQIELNKPTGSTGRNNYSTAEEGAQALMRLNIPAPGAAYLAGNIMQESSWNGQRSWGEVAGDGTSRNGGLVSWASWSDDPARLGRIEQWLGKDISKATDDEQLAAMIWEMQKYFPNQWRIFKNPFATPRQLRRASKEYWGYRDEGARFTFAEQTLAQITR